MTYEGALVLPQNCVAMQEEEMMYTEGGATKHTNIVYAIGAMVLGVGATGVLSIKSFIGAAKAISSGILTSIGKILLKYCTGLLGLAALTYAATQVFYAGVLLNTRGYYYVSSVLFNSVSYVH